MAIGWGWKAGKDACSLGGNACDITPFTEIMLLVIMANNLTFLVTASCFLPEDSIVIINSTSSQLTYICNCSMMIVKTAVCVGNGNWLPQILCGRDVCTCTDDGKVAGGQ